MSLSDIVNVSITAGSVTVSRQGFGTPLIVCYHTHNLDRVREYASVAEMVADSFSATGAPVRMATKIFAQNPKPRTIKVGRRALPPTQKFTLVPTDTTVGKRYSMVITRANGTTFTLAYTVVTSDTVALIIDGLVLALAAASPAVALTPTDNTTSLVLTAAAGVLFDVSEVCLGLTITDTTTDPGIATDLSAIEVVDADWYGLALDSNSEAEILAAAAWAESRTCVFACNTMDTGAAVAATTTDVMSDLHGFGYARTACIFSGSALSYAGAAWLGKMLPTDPGKATWKFKTLAGVSVDTLTTAQQSAIEGKDGNFYTAVAGVSITQSGISAAGEWIDVTHYLDYLKARIGENVFALLAARPKIPYTDGGVELIKSEVLAELMRGVSSGALDKTPAPGVTAPLVADISTTDRGNRHLPDVEFTGRLAGAIHDVDITGTLTV